MHESMHRAIGDLRKSGKYYVAPGSEEEAMVKALMQRAYGDVETKQGLFPGRYYHRDHPSRKAIEDARQRVKDKDPKLDEIEKVAAEEVARRHPRGPR